ncbi:hypothetical protein [Flammeovirga sp. SJP92]|uniref:hypothetical protein n=1 Tax=Flammeovirga sp. SJP92 TaxID=1775430 RepID=UPI000786996F|nr:hypothetical protein [Flammeovirga sp. SJP92]KXX72700.1 hypothetical protein AVL50_32390 [Flammeovirga sp. SJP92]
MKYFFFGFISCYLFVFLISLIEKPLTYSKTYNDKKFQSSIWLNNIEDRYEMITDLRKNHLTINMKYMDIEKILGKPQSNTLNTLSYKIGKSGLLAKYEYLNVELKDGKISSIKIITNS